MARHGDERPANGAPTDAFFCGDIHIENQSFAKLLEENDVPYAVVARRIGVAQDESYYTALEYLGKHPEVLDKPF